MTPWAVRQKQGSALHPGPRGKNRECSAPWAARQNRRVHCTLVMCRERFTHSLHEQ